MSSEIRARNRSVHLPTRPESLKLELDRAALIVVDMQNAYCSAGGYLDRVGFDVTGSAPVIAEARRVIDACKAAGIRVIYLQNGFEADLRETAPVWHKSNALRLMRENPEWSGRLLRHKP